jgi:lysophospholipase L1-like esterase
MVGRGVLAGWLVCWASICAPALSAAPARDGCAGAKGPGGLNDLAATDWAGLCQYRDSDRSLQAPGHHVVRAVFMGDSITFLWGQDNPSLFDGDYVGRGISGQTTQQILLRFRQDVIDLRPAVVHILAGTNDLLQLGGAVTVPDMAGDIRSMVELAAANHIVVVLATVPPWGGTVGSPPQRAALRAFNSWLRLYARQRKLPLADYFSVLVDGAGSFTPTLTADGVHPSKQGYARMESLAGLVLAAALDK